MKRPGYRSALLLVGVLGCANSRIPRPMQSQRPGAPPRVFRCGNDTGPTWVDGAIGMTLGMIMIGGVVTAGYFAIGGEAPLR